MDELQPWQIARVELENTLNLVRAGDLVEAARSAEGAWESAVQSLRAHGGLPSAEAMTAYYDATLALVEIAARQDPGAIAVVLDDLVEVERRARERLEQFNLNATWPVEGPTGPVDPETLVGGHLSARIALLEGDGPRALRVLETQMVQWPEGWRATAAGMTSLLLLLRAMITAGDNDRAMSLGTDLRRQVAQPGWELYACELALLESDIASMDGRPAVSLELLEDHLSLAAERGFALDWIDLLVARSRVLLELGRSPQARLSAQAALEGVIDDREMTQRWPLSANMSGAVHLGYRVGCLMAQESFVAAGGDADDVAGLSAVTDTPPRRERRTQPGRDKPARGAGPGRRKELHNRALAVLDEYRSTGRPFVLYLRKFGLEVAHGPSEYGPQTIENSLYDALGDDANIITVQDQSDLLTESPGGTVLDRDAPALLLENAEWQQVTTELIAAADVIVSECLVVSDGVRFELEAAYRTGRWDRTVLVLPPLRSAFATVDNDALVQLFPRCVWADTLHTQSLGDSHQMSDLLSRITDLAALSDDKRSVLIDPIARDEAFPIDLGGVARNYETEAALDAVFQDQDDRIRYYGFWQLFRAVSIRGYLLQEGDDSIQNRLAMADAYVQMSSIMLDNESDGEHIVLVGDLEFAEQCAMSAYNLLRDDDPAPVGGYARERALSQLGDVERVQSAIKAEPDRFVFRARYGPFTVRTSSRD